MMTNENRVVNVSPDGTVTPAKARIRALPVGTYVVVRYGVSQFKPQGKGERIARVVDSFSAGYVVTEWVLSSRRWRRTDSHVGGADVLRIATEADIARFEPGVVEGVKRSRGWR